MLNENVSLLHIIICTWWSVPCLSTEYCEGETLSILCGQSETIRINTALYGRMQLGRCVKVDLGYLGCQTDVLSIMDRLCSGRTSCQIDTVNRGIFNVNVPCSELQVYLHVEYACVPGILTHLQLLEHCVAPSPVLLSTFCRRHCQHKQALRSQNCFFYFK